MADSTLENSLDNTLVTYLVHIESSGNQRYIFDTTKRRENVGASELIYRLVEWVRVAFEHELPDFDWDVSEIENGDAAQVVSAAAGAVSVVVRGPDVARRILTEVTRRALHEAPGLDVTGMVSPPFDWYGDEADDDPARPARSSLEMAGRRARRAMPGVRASRPGPSGRFARIPVVAECTTSGLPAVAVGRDAPGERLRPLSSPSVAKRDARWAGNLRLARLAGVSAEQMDAFTEHLGDKADWVAVIHADGNSLGEVFRSLSTVSSATYAKHVRSVSDAVEKCTVAAYEAAVAEADQVCPAGAKVDGRAPVLPLVLGGDDLTVLCAGAVALPFTVAFLTAFEAETGKPGGAIRDAVGTGLTACAGVAVVKPHYPFSAAYDLAEDLAKEAKRTVKAYAPQVPAASNTTATATTTAATITGGGTPRRRPDASAFSFHLLHDSGGSDYDHLRSRMLFGTTALHAQPYVVTPALRDAGWVRGRHWDDLHDRARLLRRSRLEADEEQKADDPRLPASQLHDLRAALLSGPAAGDMRLRQLYPRYEKRGLRRFVVANTPGPPAAAESEAAESEAAESEAAESEAPDAAAAESAAGGPSLFWVVPEPEVEPGARRPSLPVRLCGLLDAMHAVDLVGDDPPRPRQTPSDGAPAVAGAASGTKGATGTRGAR